MKHLDKHVLQSYTTASMFVEQVPFLREVKSFSHEAGDI